MNKVQNAECRMQNKGRAGTPIVLRTSGKTPILLTLMLTIIGLGGLVNGPYAAVTSSQYDEMARRGMLLTNSGTADSAAIDTLAIFDYGGQDPDTIGGTKDTDRNNIADSTFEEHQIGTDFVTVSLRVRNPLGRCDSLWVHFYSENGSGPHTNPDGSSILIDNSSAADTYGVWGIYRFATQDTTVAWIDYIVPIRRGRGTAYVMGRMLHTPTAWNFEIWKGSDR